MVCRGQPCTQQCRPFQAVGTAKGWVGTKNRPWVRLEPSKQGRVVERRSERLDPAEICEPLRSLNFFSQWQQAAFELLSGEVSDLGCAVNHLPLLLQQKRENLSPLCLIPTVTSPREEQQLLASTSKVRPLSPVGWRLGTSPCSLTPTLLHALSTNSPW